VEQQTLGAALEAEHREIDGGLEAYLAATRAGQGRIETLVRSLSELPNSSEPSRGQARARLCWLGCKYGPPAKSRLLAHVACRNTVACVSAPRRDTKELPISFYFLVR
jgi:hypothetical protein